MKFSEQPREKPKPKKTRQGNSHNTKYGHKGSRKYKKPYRGQGK